MVEKGQKITTSVPQRVRNRQKKVVNKVKTGRNRAKISSGERPHACRMHLYGGEFPAFCPR